MNRRNPASRSRKSHGFCCYCKRDLLPSIAANDLAFTFDHINPKDNGGGRKVPCCRKCNSLKGNLLWVDWCWFIDNHARWWSAFATHSQVCRTIAAERARRANAGEPQIGRTP